MLAVEEVCEAGLEVGLNSGGEENDDEDDGFILTSDLSCYVKDSMSLRSISKALGI